MIRGSGKSMLGGEGFCTRSPLFLRVCTDSSRRAYMADLKKEREHYAVLSADQRLIRQRGLP